MKGAKGGAQKKVIKNGAKQPQKIVAKNSDQTPDNIRYIAGNKNFKKQILLFGGIFFLIECILAIIFYRERLVVDASYYFFHPIESGWFKIDHQRFILAFAEILPLLGSYLGLSLKTLLILYSLNHVFFFLSLFLVLVKRNDLYGALAITALLAFNTPNLFVNPFLEIWYGAGFAILLFSFLQNKIFKWKDYVWVALLEITVLFSHPENYILILFVVLLDIQRRKKFNWIHLTMFLVFIISARYKYLTIDSYEAAKFSGNFHGALGHHLLDLFKMEHIGNMVVFLFHYYWVLILLLVISCLHFFRSGKYLRGGIVLMAFLGTTGLLNLVDNTYSYTVYGSTMYVPIISIAVIPFFYDVFSTFKDKIKTWAFLIFILIVGLRFYIQIDALGPYTDRVNQMERIISACDKVGGSKFILKSNDFVKPYTDVSWSLPVETLLLSAERGKDSCRSVIRYEDINDYSKRVLTDSDAFMFTYSDVVDDKELNQKYFHISGGIYKVIDYKEK